MIRELSLKKGESFTKATLYIDLLTELIGSNASGKSNALDALLFLNRVSHGGGLFSGDCRRVNLPPLRGGKPEHGVEAAA